MKKTLQIITALVIFACTTTRAQNITTIAGNGTLGYSGDGGPATNAKLNIVQGVVRYFEGNVYIADDGNNRIRMINAFTGNITTVAGGGSSLGDGGAATAAKLDGPCFLYIDKVGNLFIGDHGEHRIRKVDHTTGIITTIAGNGTPGDTGDGGPATAAEIYAPLGMAMDKKGNLIFSDYGAYIRKIDTAGIITRIAGNGVSAHTGDGGPASAAEIYPNGLCMDAIGNIYFCEEAIAYIRKIDTAGIITTISGVGVGGFAGDGGHAATATLDGPYDITCDGSGNLFFSEVADNRVREINAAGFIFTVAGNGSGTGPLGDGGPATAASLYVPSGIDVDCAGNLYIGDLDHYRVREVNYNANHSPTFVNAPTQNIAICQCAGPMSLNTLLQVSDVDTGQTEWWVVHANPLRGTLSGFPSIGIATGGTITPTGLTYMPPCSTYYATDTFQIGIADCAGGTGLITVYVTVNPLPSSITGLPFVCDGGTDTLRDATTGGTWSSSNTGVVTIGSASGVATGIASGVDTITYTLTATGCSITKSITVNPLPAPITGTSHVCAGSTVTLADTSSGGTWSSSNTSIATVGSSGIVTGVAAGVDTITYTVVSSCGAVSSIFSLTVNPTPTVIGGSSGVCYGSTITLTDGSGGGVWTSSNTAVATVGSLSGIVAGVATGTVTISYTLPTGCFATKAITVNPVPAAITGTPIVCAGLTTTLADGSPGGVWGSSNTAVATVGSTSGIVAGAAAGTAIIAYGFPTTGCKSSVTVTVNPLPSVITGTLSVCAGATTTLSDTITGGTWTSGSTAIATIGSTSGIVSGVAAGTATITYSLGTGCIKTTTVTVNTSPAAIGGSTSVCAGAAITLSDTTTGGIWSSSNTAVATAGSLSGIVTGVAAGTATISYTIPDGCSAVLTVTVQSPAPITGTMSVCAGLTTTLSDATTGGIWSSAAPGTATVGSSSGIVTGVSSGTTTISYTWGGCSTTAAFTVNPSPASIAGTMNVCAGSTTTLSDATTGGIWSSGNTAIATVGSASGIVTGVAAGAALITYMLPAGCYTTATVTVNPLPAAITGGGIVCTGYSITFGDATSGGTWSSGSPAVATVGSGSGIVTGVSAGIAAITYTLSTGCITSYIITVDTTPAPITGITATCMGHTTTLHDASGGGTWSSSNTSVATVDTSGVVTTVSSGTAVITYTTVAGCSVTVTVAPLSISGVHNMCAWTDSLTAMAAPGGSFSSTGVTVVNLGGGLGEVHAFAPGIDTVFYTLPTGCTASVLLTVNHLPGPITGIFHACSGATVTLSDTSAGGSWSCTPTTIATIGSATGIVTGVATGTAIVTYTLATGCFTDTPVAINPAPTAIGGDGFVCIGSTITLTDGISGGTWISSNPSIATIGSSSGVVTGVATGIDTITYTLCGTSVSIAVTVSPLAQITGNNTVCMGSTMTLTNSVSGGVWTTSNTAIATIGSASGIVTPVMIGIVTVTYTLSAGCTVTFPIAVDTNSGSCVPCAVFGSYSRIGTTGYIISNLGANNYYIPNNVTVTGTDTFTNAIIMMGAGDTLFVDTGSFLVLDTSHLFSGCSEWAGMMLKPARTHSGRLAVMKHSLIEDAMCAVFIPYAVTPTSGNIFTSDDAIYNRNVVGIHISNYTPNTGTYPFRIRNTVITSRDFQTGNPSYPHAWPPMYNSPSLHDGLKSMWAPATVFDVPFNIDNFSAQPYLYKPAYCYGNIMPAYGIWLEGIGTNTPSALTGMPIPASYAEIVIGDETTTTGNTYQNLIDHYNFGIKATNTNMTCVNNAFTNIFAIIPPYTGGPSSPGGDAIYAGETNDVANENRLRVYSSTGSPYHNVFYEFNLGVEVSNYLQVIAQHNYLVNKNFGTLYTPPAGSGGYSIKTAKYDTVDISNDTINNVANGVAMWLTADPTIWPCCGGIVYPSQYMGSCNISNNVIQAHPDWTATLTNQYVNLAIAYQNSLMHPPPSDLVSYNGNLTIDGNIIHDAYSGIYVNYYWTLRQKPYAESNTIYLRPNPARAMHLQYGINYTQCLSGVIGYNTVQGHMPPTTTLNPMAVDSIKAYYLSGWNYLTNVGCWNTAENTGRGFEYFLNNLYTNFHDDTMRANGKGMVLNGAVISPQVNGGTPTAPRDMHMTWAGTWSASTPQTYVMAADAHSSWFCTYSSDAPTVNSGDIHTTIFADWYGASGTIITPVTPAAECYPITSPPPMSDSGNAFDQMAQQLISFGTALMPSNWMGQYALWKTIALDTSIADSSAALREFAILAANSRYKYLTDIETALSTGDVTTATAMLGYNIDSMADTAYDTVTQVKMADGTAADYIVRNYQQFYGIYINYITAAMTSADSINILALAQLCPELNGGVVFQARALYSDIFNDLTMFNDDSCLTVDTTYFASKHVINSKPSQATIQHYSLFPNPNDGSFTLQQLIPDGQPVKVEVWNAVGVNVYNDVLNFNGGTDNLRIMNAVHGLYLLRLTDSNNRQFMLKFVLQ